MITLIIIEKNKIIRLGLKEALEETKSVDLLADYADVAEMIPGASRLEPDVVILVGIGSLAERCQACKDIRDLLPGARVLMLTERQLENDELREIIMSGASGYVLISAEGAEIMRTVNIVAADGLSFCGDDLISLVGRVPRQDRDDRLGVLNELTERERTIMALVSHGYSYEEIGQKLNLSKYTVRNHVSEIKSKLNVKSKLPLVRLAIELGLEDDP